MWILIAYLYVSASPAMMSVPDFDNYDACNKAGQAFGGLPTFGRYKFICVNRNTGATAP
jgi:hypothetical protein